MIILSKRIWHRLLVRLGRRPRYAEGGYIGPRPPTDSVPFLLSPGFLLTSAQYRKLGPATIEALWPDCKVEIVYSADEVREHGQRVLERMRDASQ